MIKKTYHYVYEKPSEILQFLFSNSFSSRYENVPRFTWLVARRSGASSLYRLEFYRWNAAHLLKRYHISFYQISTEHFQISAEYYQHISCHLACCFSFFSDDMWNKARNDWGKNYGKLFRRITVETNLPPLELTFVYYVLMADSNHYHRTCI